MEKREKKRERHEVHNARMTGKKGRDTKKEEERTKRRPEEEMRQDKGFKKTNKSPTGFTTGGRTEQTT